MAYDPEARETSNSALIIGIVALVLVVGGALAYFATRRDEPTVVANPTVIRETTEVAVPANPAPVVVPPTVIVAPQATPRTIVVPGKTTIIDRRTTTNTTKIVPGNTTTGSGTTPARAPGTSVTINNNPSASSRAGNTATGTTGGTTGSSGTAETGAQEDAAAAANATTNPGY